MVVGGQKESQEEERGDRRVVEASSVVKMRTAQLREARKAQQRGEMSVSLLSGDSVRT